TAPVARAKCHIPLLSETALRQVHELQAEVVHPRSHFFDPVQEVVVENRGGDGGGQAESGCDQRLGNSRSDRTQACSALLPEALKRIHDAPHSAEQPDERGGGSRGGEPAHVALEPGDLFTRSQLHGALQSGDIVQPAFSIHLPLHFLIAELKHNRQRRRMELRRERVHLGQLLGAAERLQELLIPILRTAQGSQLGKNNGPGKQGEEKQQDRVASTDLLQYSSNTEI